MRIFHANFAYVVIALNLAVGLWGLFLYRAKRDVPKAFWPAVISGHAVVAIQVVIGVVLQQRVSPPWQHTFYGFVVLIAAALSYQFLGREPRRMLLVFSVVALFIGSVSIRAYTTA